MTASAVPALTLPIASWLASWVTSPEAVIVHQRAWLQVAMLTPCPLALAWSEIVIAAATSAATPRSLRGFIVSGRDRKGRSPPLAGDRSPS